MSKKPSAAARRIAERVMESRNITMLYHAVDNELQPLIEALEGISNFAWTAVDADCDESREYLNSLITNVRVALSRYRGAA